MTLLHKERGAKLANMRIERKEVLQLFFLFQVCVWVFFFVVFFLHMRKCKPLALPLSAAHSWLTNTWQERRGERRKRKLQRYGQSLQLQTEILGEEIPSLLVLCSHYLPSRPTRFPSLSLSGLFAYLSSSSHLSLHDAEEEWTHQP